MPSSPPPPAWYVAPACPAALPKQPLPPRPVLTMCRAPCVAQLIPMASSRPAGHLDNIPASMFRDMALKKIQHLGSANGKSEHATGDLGPGDALQKQGLAMGKVELTTLRRHTTNLKKTFKAWADAWAEKPETRIASPTIGSPTGCAQSPVWFSPASPSTPATDSSVTDGPGALTSPMFPTSMKVSNFYERRL